LYLVVEKKRSLTNDAASAVPSAVVESTIPATLDISASRITPDSQSADSQPAAETNTSSTSLDLELMADAFLNDTDDLLPNHVDTRDFMFKMAKLAATKAYLMHEVLAVSGLRRFSKDRGR
jgi:cytoskeletal protein RodZ